MARLGGEGRKRPSLPPKLPLPLFSVFPGRRLRCPLPQGAKLSHGPAGIQDRVATPSHNLSIVEASGCGKARVNHLLIGGEIMPLSIDIARKAFHLSIVNKGG